MAALKSVRPLVCVGVLAAVAATGAASSSRPMLKELPAAVQHRHAPVKDKHQRDDGSFTSTNWSGYAVTGSSFTEADGSWTVPAVDCSTGGTQYSSFWVGIDGFSSSSVEQTGTDSDCSSGTAQYYVWFEFYPHPSYEVLGFNVKPGDVLTATITYSSGNRAFTTLISSSNGQHYSTTSRVSAQRSSAEWIAEAPSSSGGILTLANFGTVKFDTANATYSVNGRATKKPLSGFGSTATQYIEMVTSANVPLAIPSVLNPSTGVVFTDTYQVGAQNATKQSVK